jgi:lipoyl-dependent peroxiredoxin
MAYVTLDRNNKVNQGTNGSGQTLYTAAVIATGGRSGEAQSSDRNLTVNLSIPREMGGTRATGTNPEQLFGAAFASSFEDSLMVAAKLMHIQLGEPFIQAKVSLGPVGEGVTGISVQLHIYIPGVERSVVDKLVSQAESICPYANAVRGNVHVGFVIEEQVPLFQAQ